MSKVIMQGKLIAVAYTNIGISSLWAEFVYKNILISVRLVSEEDKLAFNFENFYNSLNSSLGPEYFIDFYVKDGSHVRL